MVAGIDVERARDSFLGRKLLEQMDTKDAEFAKFVAMTGFDPRRDLREIIIATPDANTKNPPALILVRGIFDMSWGKQLPKDGGERTVLAQGHSCRSQVKRFAGFVPQHPMEALRDVLAEQAPMLAQAAE